MRLSERQPVVKSTQTVLTIANTGSWQDRWAQRNLSDPADQWPLETGSVSLATMYQPKNITSHICDSRFRLTLTLKKRGWISIELAVINGTPVKREWRYSRRVNGLSPGYLVGSPTLSNELSICTSSWQNPQKLRKKSREVEWKWQRRLCWEGTESKWKRRLISFILSSARFCPFKAHHNYGFWAFSLIIYAFTLFTTLSLPLSQQGLTPII